MFYPNTHPWTSAQKLMIAAAIGLGAVLVAGFIYSYELHLRRSIRDTLIDHQWNEQGCMDCSHDITFRRDNTIEVEDTGVGQIFRGKGTWQLQGRDYIALDYETRRVGAEELEPDHYRRSLHIAKLTDDELILDSIRSPFHYVYKRAK
jgi:hypothetical protein